MAEMISNEVKSQVAGVTLVADASGYGFKQAKLYIPKYSKQDFALALKIIWLISFAFQFFWIENTF